jgi:PPK2 family polyphosphate:nucleotide phosphotransferase
MAHRIEDLIEKLIVPPGKKVDLRKDYDPAFKADYLDKQEAEGLLAEGIQRLAEFQDKLYAQDNYSLLIVLQALDAAGKDGTIKHVMTGLNPQGTQVTSFKAPSAEEMNHDYLWRHVKALPQRGQIGIFNRSYYEELLIARVHPNILAAAKIPAALKDKKIWTRRFAEINNFEKFLVDNGTVVLKLFLNVSKEEQGRRFMERITLPEKNWKFSAADLAERDCWDDYQAAYEDVFNHTSTEWAPWYVLPADHKWFTRLAAAGVIYATLDGLGLAYPTVNEQQTQALAAAKVKLEAQGITREPDAAPTEKQGKRKKKK